MNFWAMFTLGAMLRFLWESGILPIAIIALILWFVWENYKIQIIIMLSLCVLLFILCKYIAYIKYQNATPEERQLSKMINDWQNGVQYTEYIKSPEKLELEKQATVKIKQLAQDYVKDFIKENKTEFTNEDLKEFTVIVKFKNGIVIPKLKMYAYKEHPFLLDILEETYKNLKNNS